MHSTWEEGSAEWWRAGLFCFLFWNEADEITFDFVTNAKLAEGHLSSQNSGGEGSLFKLRFLQEGPVADGVSSGKLVLQKTG